MITRRQKTEDRGQRTEDRRQWLCRYATTKFYKLMLAKPHNSVFSPLSSALCPLSSIRATDFCPKKQV
ncbi:hypothetical protein CbuD7D7780_09730 [Coxiella burnetii]|nr:hypothetical protein CbuD7E6568_09710 [Coxiella burnetii]OYK81456.1 hypothetical protein CbuD7D7780_09730 [Coxiella burnetii]